MTGLVMALLVVAVQATPWSQTVTEQGCQNLSLPTTFPAIVFVKYAAEMAQTAVSLKIKYDKSSENFTFTKDDKEKNVIALILKEKKRGEVLSMQTGKTKGIWRTISQLSICSEQRVTWQVFTIPPALMNISTTQPPVTDMNTTLPNTYCTSSRLNPTTLSLASICALLALSTLILSILHCRRCASDKNGPGHSASNSNAMTFRSTEALVNEQASFPSSYIGQGSLHISENSLYGVIM